MLVQGPDDFLGRPRRFQGRTGLDNSAEGMFLLVSPEQGLDARLNVTGPQYNWVLPKAMRMTTG